jgi:hypothetical protein
MPLFPLVAWPLSVLLALVAEAAQGAVAGQPVAGRWRHISSVLDSQDDETRQLAAEHWVQHLPEGLVGTPGALAREHEDDLFYLETGLLDPEDDGDPDTGFFHVTTRKQAVVDSGQLLAPREVGRAGLGGGYMNAAPGEVSVTTSRERAEHLKRVLRLAVLAARDQISGSELAQALVEVYRPWFWWEGTNYERDELAQVAYAIEVIDYLTPEAYNDLFDKLQGMGLTSSEDIGVEETAEDDAEGLELTEVYDDIMEGDGWRMGAREQLIDTVEGNSWIPMRAILDGDYAAPDVWLDTHAGTHGRGRLLYELVRWFDKELGRLAAPPHLPGPSVGLTLDWKALRNLDPEDVRVLQVAVDKNVMPEVVPAEVELRFPPSALVLAPITYGAIP